MSRRYNFKTETRHFYPLDYYLLIVIIMREIKKDFLFSPKLSTGYISAQSVILHFSFTLNEEIY